MTGHTSAKMSQPDDRIFILRPAEGKKALASNGLVDTRLFTGTNRIHVKQDENSLWYIQLDMGLVPPGINQLYTSGARAISAMKGYYSRRNIEVEEILE